MNQHIKNILNNTSILKKKYEQCIVEGKQSFQKVEKKFIEKLIEEIDIKLKEYLDTHQIDFHKDIQSSYYEVLTLVRFDNWEEYKEYIKFINGISYDRTISNNFIYNSLKKYGFPMENVFCCNDNGWFRYKLMDFAKESKSEFGASNETYE